MIFLNFSQLLESVFRKKKKKTFLKIKLNFSLIRKYFSLINYFNNKQKLKKLKNNF